MPKTPSSKIKNWLWEQPSQAPTSVAKQIYSILKTKFERKNNANNNEELFFQNIKQVDEATVTFSVNISPEKQNVFLKQVHQLATIELQQNLGVKNNIEEFLKDIINQQNNNKTTFYGFSAIYKNPDEVKISMFTQEPGLKTRHELIESETSSTIVNPKTAASSGQLEEVVQHLINENLLKQNNSIYDKLVKSAAAYKDIVNKILFPLVSLPDYKGFTTVYKIKEINLDNNNTSEVFIKSPETFGRYQNLSMDSFDTLPDSYVREMLVPQLLKKLPLEKQKEIVNAVTDNFKERFDWNPSANEKSTWTITENTNNREITFYITIPMDSLTNSIISLVSGNYQNMKPNVQKRYDYIKKQVEKNYTAGINNETDALLIFNVSELGITPTLNSFADFYGVFAQPPNNVYVYDWNLEPNGTTGIFSLFQEKLKVGQKVTHDDVVYLFQELPWFQEIKTIFG